MKARTKNERGERMEEMICSLWMCGMNKGKEGGNGEGERGVGLLCIYMSVCVCMCVCV